MRRLLFDILRNFMLSHMESDPDQISQTLKVIENYVINHDCKEFSEVYQKVPYPEYLVYQHHPNWSDAVVSEGECACIPIHWEIPYEDYGNIEDPKSDEFIERFGD